MNNDIVAIVFMCLAIFFSAFQGGIWWYVAANDPKSYAWSGYGPISTSS